jgi:hypothetical protein
VPCLPGLISLVSGDPIWILGLFINSADPSPAIILLRLFKSIFLLSFLVPLCGLDFLLFVVICSLRWSRSRSLVYFHVFEVWTFGIVVPSFNNRIIISSQVKYGKIDQASMGSSNRTHRRNLYSPYPTTLTVDLVWAAFWGFLYPKAFFDMFTPYTALLCFI